jgi:hypothetical protein
VHVDMPNAGLAHEAAHAMERIRRRSPARATSSPSPPPSISTMEVLDEIRSQVGVVYPSER